MHNPYDSLVQEAPLAILKDAYWRIQSVDINAAGFVGAGATMASHWLLCENRVERDRIVNDGFNALYDELCIKYDKETARLLYEAGFNWLAAHELPPADAVIH